MRKSFATSRAVGRHNASVVRGPRHVAPLVIMLVATLGAAPALRAQVVPGSGAGIGTMSADRARVRQITGAPRDSIAATDSLPYVRAIRPTIRYVWNSDLPNGGNDGALWAGRGANLTVTGGAEYTRAFSEGTLSIVVAPEVDYSQNITFSFFSGRQPGRSAFSSPWHTGQSSADLPLRFGDLPVKAVGLGQSSVTFTTSRVAFGASAASEWWGPALRNTLLLSNNAAGVPRLFARTSRPLRTRVGQFEGRAIIGALTESPYFDQDAGNDIRSLSGLLIMYRPSIDTGLTLGLSRLVMARASSGFGVIQHTLDDVLMYEEIESPADTGSTGQSYQRTDQLISLFARWVFPESGFETYVEWARMELPRSVREFLEVPQSTQGYTIGLQYAQPHRNESYFRLQGEVTYLEQTEVLPAHSVPDYYAGRAAPQGFTQRGQVLGAAIGPGSSTQFIGMDWMAHTWQAGAFVGRTRTENDAMYREASARASGHDVTIFSGVRGGVRLPWTDLSGELTVGRRMNYLFQSDYYLGSPVVATDIQNVTLSMTLSPR